MKNGQRGVVGEKHQQPAAFGSRCWVPPPLWVFSTHNTSPANQQHPSAYFSKACASATRITSSCPKV